MSEEEEITAKKESTMETVDNKLSHYCPHYERDTCLILFKCCNEWYPCHKCHNEALTSLVEQNEMEPENSGPSPENEIVSVEMDDAEVESFDESIEIGSGAEEAQQEDTSTTGNEADVNTAGGTSDEQSNRQIGACNDENGVRAETKVHEMDATSFSPSGMQEKHSVATAVDGIQAFGQQRENSQRSCSSHCRGDCKFPMEEQESNRPYHWKDDDSMLEKRDGLEIIGEVKDTYTDVVSGPSDEPSNDESEEDNEENGVEAGSEENDLQVPINGLPLSADGTGKTHSIATSLDGALLKCAQCKEEQEFSKECKKCHRSFAKYSCEICKLLIENDVDPYHCPDCGICRANEKDHFHCEVCKVCMSRSIKDSHICSDNRGHDPCAICLEEVFTGASTFSCLHIVHKECAIKLIRSGSLVCPMCRTAILQNDQNKMIAEIPSNQSILEKVRTAICNPIKTLSRLLKIPGVLSPENSGISMQTV